MSKIKLYIATTIDGYIAREDGSLDWLFELPNPNNIDHGYTEFMTGIDTIVMGRKTYDEVLGFGVQWSYPDQKTFVVSGNTAFRIKTENTFLLNEINTEVVGYLRSVSKKNIWIVGGGELISHFLKIRNIDELILSVIPIILGKGIRLFQGEYPETRFTLINAESFDTGIVNLYYSKVVK